jgi:hypothetical protein
VLPEIDRVDDWTVEYEMLRLFGFTNSVRGGTWSIFSN